MSTCVCNKHEIINFDTCKAVMCDPFQLVLEERSIQQLVPLDNLRLVTIDVLCWVWLSAFLGLQWLMLIVFMIKSTNPHTVSAMYRRDELCS